MTECGINNVLICTCDGDKDSVYKHYSTITKSFTCCNNPFFPVLEQNFTDVKQYLSALNSYYSEDTYPCKTFYNNIISLSETDFKTKYEELYSLLEGRMLLNNIIYEGGEPTFTESPDGVGTKGAKISCKTGYFPVFISNEDNYPNISRLETFGCVEIGGTFTPHSTLDYKLFYLKDQDGESCKTEECVLATDFFSNAIIGDVLLNSAKDYTHLKNPYIVGTVIGASLLFIGLIVFYIYSVRDKKMPFKNKYRRLTQQMNNLQQY